jgi:chromosomal replication initiation ATPase DnaA
MTTKEKIYVTYKIEKNSFNIIQDIVKKKGIIIDDLKISKVNKDIRPFKIIQLVEDVFNINILNRNRKQSTVYARQSASFLLRRYTLLSLSQIALHVGVKDHSTVYYHIKKCQDIIDTEEWFKDKINSIINELDEYILYLSKN